MRRCLVIALGLLLAGCADSPAARAEREARAGLALAMEGRVGEAVERFHAALALDPANPAARYNLGLAHLREGQWVLAAEAFARFVEQRPDDALGHFELARAQALAGWSHAALASLAAAVRLGFADHDLLVRDGAFVGLFSDPQYLALEMTVAQRAGVDPVGGVLAVPGGDSLGGSTRTLPGVRLRGVEKPCAKGLCVAEDG